ARTEFDRTNYNSSPYHGYTENDRHAISGQLPSSSREARKGGCLYKGICRNIGYRGIGRCRTAQTKNMGAGKISNEPSVVNVIVHWWIVCCFIRKSYRD